MKKVIFSVLACLALLAPAVAGPSVSAQTQNARDQITKGVGSVSEGSNNSLEVSVKNIVNALLYIAGAVAVVMIVIGGIRFVISNGDVGTVTAARNTVLYSVIGLVVIILAYAIVNFVVGSLSK